MVFKQFRPGAQKGLLCEPLHRGGSPLWRRRWGKRVRDAGEWDAFARDDDDDDGGTLLPVTSAGDTHSRHARPGLIEGEPQ